MRLLFPVLFASLGLVGFVQGKSTNKYVLILTDFVNYKFFPAGGGPIEEPIGICLFVPFDIFVNFAI